ncbi:PHP domain-containing protein [Desulfovibrio inopinatus]|uniref:PHP domain-containing protein n=1 Tax=Desulfovibrio inopinatus TaxID=102109 RepID=UPI0004812E2D|nr:PHP domain-containing protein [Desulfovibrio inopinatus]
MQIDFHVHTSVHSACAIMEPEEVCQTALECRLSGVVFTEHHATWPREELNRLEEKYPGIRLYGGVEWSLAEGYDILAISKAPLPDLAPFSPLGEVIEHLTPIREQTVLIAAHPFRFTDFIDAGLDHVLRVCDAIESASGNIMRAGFIQSGNLFISTRGKLYAEASRLYDLTPLCNSDGHMTEALGTFANIYPDAPMGDQAWLVDLLRTVKPKPWQNPQRVRTYLQRKGYL